MPNQWKTQEEEKSVIKTRQTAERSPELKFSKQTSVIFCDPNYPIYFIESFFRFAKSHFNVSVSTHVHSTVTNLPNELAEFCSDFLNVNANADISLTLIWKPVGIDPIMILQGMHEIHGVVNIARYFNRLIELINKDVLKYEQTDPLYANKIDTYLNQIHCALHVVNNNASLNICKKSHYVMGNDISIVDLILESIDTYKRKKM